MDKIGSETLNIMEKSAGWYNKWLFSLVEDKIQGEILDVGAGVGTFVEILRRKGKITAIDINSDYIQKIREKYASKIEVGFGDIESNKLFFKDKKFDTIVCFNVLEHIRYHKKAIKNTFRLLKRKGKLILLVPAHEFLYSKFDKNLGHYRRYEKKAIVNIMREAGYSNISARYVNWWGALGWFIIFRFFRFPKMCGFIFSGS